ncbi:MAG: hypothetical protein LBV52_03550, partial [Spirochaetaceae bacterium]|nr:hypothetical protein [Spirochaetaceae bacterium]
MTRNRKLIPIATYIVSSYIVRAEADLEDDFTQKMFLSALKRAIEKFKFTADKITFLKSGFT